MRPKAGHSNTTPLSPPTLTNVASLAQLSRKILPEAASEEKKAVPQRSTRRRLSLQAIDELIWRYTVGEETPTLSQEFGISVSGLRDLLRAEGVSLRGRFITVHDADRAVHLYERGLTITEVVTRIGYSHDTIRKVLLKHGVTIRTVSHGKRASRVPKAFWRGPWGKGLGFAYSDFVGALVGHASLGIAKLVLFWSAEFKRFFRSLYTLRWWLPPR